MRTRAVFHDITIAHFRGFNAPQKLDLNASAVLLRGPNGVGKTSVFDAFQWLLTGDIPRLKSARLRVTDEHLVNAYSGNRTARVSATIRVGNQFVEVERSGDRSGSILSWHAGDGEDQLTGAQAEVQLARAFGAPTPDELHTTLTAAGLLQQDEARLVLHSKPRDRFALFSSLLGLGELEEFEAWAGQRAKAVKEDLSEAQAAEASLEMKMRQLSAMRAELREASLQGTAARDLVYALGQALQSWDEKRSARQEGPADYRRLANVTSSVAAELRRISMEWRELDAELAVLGGNLGPVDARADQDRVTALDREIVDLEVQVQEVGAQLAEAESSKVAIDRMVAAVLPLLTTTRCPVCRQRIDPNEVREHLQGESREGASTAELIETMRLLDQRLSALRRERTAVSDRLKQWAISHAREEALNRRQEDLGEAARATLAETRELLALGTVDVSGPEHLDEVAAKLERIGSAARALVRALDKDSAREESRLTKELASAERQLSEVREQLEAVSRAARDAEAAFRAVRAARVDVVSRRLSQLTPIAQDVYSRLDPHPTFRQISIASEVFRAAGTATAKVTDEASDVTADPMLIFSSAQANIAAISYLIALNWAVGGNVPTLLLDDPLQAMDEINVLGFADLCRHLRTERQLMFSTHERRFGQLLERKLAPRSEDHRTVVHDFVGWDRSGPQIKAYDVAPQLEAGWMRLVPSQT